MKKNLVFLFVLFIGSTAAAQNNNLFYYSFDQKIYLTHVAGKFVTEFTTPQDSTYFSSRNILGEKFNNEMYKVQSDFSNR